MRRGVVAVVAWLTTVMPALGADLPKDPGAGSPTAQIDFARDVVPFLTKHCYGCHGNGKSRGDLTLDRFRDEPSVEKERKVWENVIEMISAGEMPPKTRPRPAAGESERVLLAIDSVLNKLDC